MARELAHVRASELLEQARGGLPLPVVARAWTEASRFSRTDSHLVPLAPSTATRMGLDSGPACRSAA